MRLTIITALAVLAMAAPAAARTTKQFREFFSAWHSLLNGIIDDNCPQELALYQDSNNPDIWAATTLTNCILENMTELRKTEMGISAVVLGLLPTMLQQIGPTVSEVGVLASRRPLLSLLLAVAMPSVSIGGDMANPIEGLRRPVRFRMRTGALAHNGWRWVLMSTAEYIIAAAAVFNTWYQIYHLANFSISISAISIPTGLVSQTYAPFLWAVLVLPAHLLYFWSFKLKYKRAARGDSSDDEVTRKSGVGVLATEFALCAAGEPMRLAQVDTGLGCFAVEFITDVASLIVFVFGTIALSAQAFLSLGDVIPIVARFLASTLIGRLVILFELHGIREANSATRKKDVLLGEAPHGGYEQDSKGVLAQVQPV